MPVGTVLKPARSAAPHRLLRQRRRGDVDVGDRLRRAAHCAPRRRRSAPPRRRRTGRRAAAAGPRPAASRRRRSRPRSRVEPFVERADDAGGDAPDALVRHRACRRRTIRDPLQIAAVAGDGWPDPSGSAAAPRRRRRPRAALIVERKARPHDRRAPARCGSRCPTTIVRHAADDLDMAGVKPDLLVRLAQRRVPPATASVGSMRPPGNATCPEWLRSVSARLVRITRRLRRHGRPPGSAPRRRAVAAFADHVADVRD